MISKENIINLINSTIKDSDNEETKEIYQNYNRESIDIEIISEDYCIMVRLNNGIREDILVINEEYNIAFIADSVERTYVNPDSVIIFNGDYYKYNMFFSIYNKEVYASHFGDYYLVYREKYFPRLGKVFITPLAYNLFMKNMRAIEKLINAYMFMLLVKGVVKIGFRLTNIGQNENVITLQKKNDIQNVKNLIHGKNCKLYKIMDTNNYYVIDISGQNLMDVYDILYIE